MTTIYYQLINKVQLEDINSFSTSVKEHLLLKKNEIKFKESLAGWSLLKQMLPYIDFKYLDVKFNEYGKPECREFYFNISHSKDIVVVAVSNYNVGVDVEYINFNKNIDGLSIKLLNKTVSHFEFYEVFTKKEAYIKYKGKSIGYPKNSLIKDIENVKSVIIKYDEKEYYLSYLTQDEEVIIKEVK